MWKLLVKEHIASLLDSRLCSWLLVNRKCTRLECMMIPLVKVKQQQQILREEYEIPYQNYGEVEDQPAHSVMQLYLSDSVFSLL